MGFPTPTNVVHLKDCQYCGAPLIIAPTTRSTRERGLLPPSPNTGAWRAFEREQVVSRRSWRSTKRYGFIPNVPGNLVGFLPHDCPNAEWKKSGVSVPSRPVTRR